MSSGPGSGPGRYGNAAVQHGGSSMVQSQQQAYNRIGSSKAMENHDRDMVHELAKRADAVWHIDQYIENAKDHKELRQFWEELKQQEMANVEHLREMIRKHCQEGHF